MEALSAGYCGKREAKFRSYSGVECQPFAELRLEEFASATLPPNDQNWTGRMEIRLHRTKTDLELLNQLRAAVAAAIEWIYAGPLDDGEVESESKPGTEESETEEKEDCQNETV